MAARRAGARRHLPRGSEHYVAALDADDLDAAITTVSPAHGAFHALTGGAYAALAEEAGIAAGAGHDDDDHD